MARTVAAILFSILFGGLTIGRPARAGDEPSQDPKQLEGRWELWEAGGILMKDLGEGIPKKYRCEHYFFPGGLWGCVVADGRGDPRVYAGSWSVREGLLAIRDPRSDPVAPVVWLPMPLLDDRMMRPAKPEPVLDPLWAWITEERPRLEIVSADRLRLRGQEPTTSIRHQLHFSRRDGVTSEQLTGTWGVEGGLRMTFGADGTYRKDATLRGQRVHVEGTWQLRGGVIHLALDDGVRRTLAPILTDRLSLISHDEGGSGVDEVVLSRADDAPKPKDTSPSGPTPIAPPGPSPVPAAAPQGVVGVWVAPMEGGQAKITFRADGTYAREWPEGGALKRFTGTYTVKGSALVVEDAESPGEMMKVPFVQPGADELQLTIEGEVLRLTREGAAPRADEPAVAAEPVPAALHGTWLARDETGSIRLELTPDARFVLALENGPQKWRYAGPCGARGGVIQGRDEATGNPIALPYRQADANTLVVTLNEVELHLKKQGAAPVGAGDGGKGSTPPPAGGVPPELLGTWRGDLITVQSFEAGSVSLTFQADKTYSLLWRLTGGHMIPRSGTYTVAGNVLTLRAKNEAAITLEFRVAGNQLTLDAFAAMQPATLTRQP